MVSDPLLGELIDAASVQSLMADFYDLTRLPMAVIDTQGRVLVGVGWQDICTRFHRVHPETCRACVESDTQLSIGVAPGEFQLYKCKNQMWDAATPIMVGDRHVGNLFSGQFFLDDETVDEDLFRQQARRYRFDEDAYLTALAAVPRISREALDRGLAFFVKLAHVLSGLGETNLRLARTVSERDRALAAESEFREERRRSEANRQVLTEVLRTLNRGGEQRTLIADTLRVIRETTGFDAVGLRLREGDDWPYYEQSGFSEEFVRAESCLCSRNEDGTVRRREDGAVELECTCGLVLSGCMTVTAPSATENGTFWTNRSSEWLNVAQEDDPRLRPRNRCVHDGFQSLGLFPVKGDQQIIGLLQMNDRNSGRFTAESISFYESIAQNVGLALQRAAAERRLREANARLSETDRRKTEFIAVLSHELRNPLAPIRFALPVLGRQSLDEGGRRSLAVLARQTDHLTRLVDDLLDVSRITSGKIELRREHVTLGSVLTAAAEAASPAIIHRRHTLRTRISDDPIWLHADAARLAQILTNLLDNSAKYTPPGGEIVLEACRESGEAVVRVRDNGIGIPAAGLPHVFEIFHQVERPDKPQGGLGIGLAVAKRLIELQGGTIEVHSAGIGQGSEFVVRLPVAEASGAVDAEAESPTSPAPRELRVLIVDDNADLVEMLAVVVERAGHRVRKALDGQSAVAVALSYRPHVVLLDLGLPELDGIEVARELRRRPETRHCRLVALTGWGQDADRRRTQEAGFDDHITKPADPKALERVLRDAAEQSLD